VGDAEVLFGAYRDRVFRYLCRIVGSGQASELTQDVFLRVARGPVPIGDEGGRRAWVFSIARNLALNHVRDTRRHGTAVELVERQAAPTQELSVAINEALDQLDSLDRDVFLLRESAGLSYDEIARVSGLTADAVRSRLHRSRLQLRKTLSPSLHRNLSGNGVRLYGRPDGKR
jgi:RNA polymerase sigma-70 factor (ECF subfamily)